MILGLQAHKSGITWKHAEDTTAIYKTLQLVLHIKKRPIWHRKLTNKAPAPTYTSGGPPGSVQDARRREGRHSWAGRTTGSAGPTLAPNRPSFGGKNDLIYIRRFPYVSIFISGGNRPPWAIKGASLTPSHTHHSREDVVLHSKGEALPRLVLRIGGGWGVVRGSAGHIGGLLRSCTSMDAGFLWYE